MQQFAAITLWLWLNEKNESGSPVCGSIKTKKTYVKPLVLGDLCCFFFDNWDYKWDHLRSTWKKQAVALPRSNNPLKFQQAALITPTHRFQTPYLSFMPPSHSRERYIWRMPWGNFIKFVTNTHLDSRMIGSDFGGRPKGQGHSDLTKHIFCRVKWNL